MARDSRTVRTQDIAADALPMAEPVAKAQPESPAPKKVPVVRVRCLKGMLHNGMAYSEGQEVVMLVAEAERREKRGEAELID